MQQQQHRGITPLQAAIERVEFEKPKHPGDLRAAHRAAEVHFWAQWYRSGTDIQERSQPIAQAAILCSDLYFEPLIKGKEEDAS